MNTHRLVEGRQEVQIPPWPGLWVCGEHGPTQADGMCGHPVTVMPCPIHHPEATS